MCSCSSFCGKQVQTITYLSSMPHCAKFSALGRSDHDSVYRLRCFWSIAIVASINLMVVTDIIAAPVVLANGHAI